MRILFLTLGRISDISARGIYTDLLRKFRDEGHEVYVMSPAERREKAPSSLEFKDGVWLLRVKSLNITKTNLIEKGVATLLIEQLFLRAIARFLGQVKFDLVMYSTPPVTLGRVVRHMKRRDGARSYLLLKDIFPQNAVDLGLLRPGRLMHRYFRAKEKELYSLSDSIGCMSPANVEYLLRHNPEIDPAVVHVNPNSIEPRSVHVSEEERREIRDRFGIPHSAVAFIYGGNLGRPQGVGFLLEVLEANRELSDRFFVIVGSGTEFGNLQSWFERIRPKNACLHEALPVEDYSRLVSACDVGLIFLDRRFTIPNFPSRLLSYLEAGKPVLAATDRATDLGIVMEERGFGWWCESGDLAGMVRLLDQCIRDETSRLRRGGAAHSRLLAEYTVNVSYESVITL